MQEHIFRLKKGDDLYDSIQKFCQENNILAGVVVSGVGSLLSAHIRDASGVNAQDVNEPTEIVSLNGTVSKNRLHLHISLSKTDLSVVGGHLMSGCKINTTCEIAILEFENYEFSKEFDKTTGYNELKIIKK